MERSSRNTIVYLVAVLTGVGMVAVYSVSSGQGASRQQLTYFPLMKHAIWLALGWAGLIVAAMYDFRKLERYDKLLLGLTLVTLIAVLIFGTTRKGATRWIRFGSHFGFQPSEIAKLAMIVFVAGFASRNRAHIREFKRGLLPPLIAVAAVSGLIVVEPDLGTAVMIGSVAMVMLYVAGARLLHLSLLALCGVGTVACLILVAPYRVVRVLIFLNPWKDPSGAGYHLIQSFIALGSGGLWGRGIGASHQKLFFLPESSSDFIFSIIGEEMGFVRSVALMLIFVLLVREGVKVALRAPNFFGSLLAMGISMAIGMQTAINIAVVTGSMPTKGISLPFVSSGGSSLVMTMVSVGILLNIARQSEEAVSLPQARTGLVLRGGYTYDA